VQVRTAVVTHIRGLIGSLGAILLGAIALAFGFSIFLTVSGFVIYITYRFVFHVQAYEGRGVGAWVAETMTRFGLIDVNEVQKALSASSEPKLPNGKAEQKTYSEKDAGSGL
jgi:hypothetical protein